MTRENLSHLRVLGKVSAISLILLLISLTIFAGAVGAEEEAIVMVEGFRYEEKVYDGVRGPGGIWYQYIQYGDAEYSVAKTAAGYVYIIDSSGYAYSIYGFGYPHLYDSHGNYIGPEYYEFKVRIMIEKGAGGIVVRVQKESDGKPAWNSYYRVLVDPHNDRMTLWDGKLVAEAHPDLDYGKWYYLYLRFSRGSKVVAKLVGSGVSETLEYIDRSPFPPGSFGVYAGGYIGEHANRVHFDAAWLTVLIPEETTITTTETVTEKETLTKTMTATEEKTVTETTTAPGAMATTTITATSTTTIPASTITKTVTKTETTTATGEAITKTITETKEITKTVTSTATAQGGPRCLIATAAFGSELAPQVQALREFRDGFIMKTFAGRNFMTAFNAFYYSWSPYVARAEYENPILRSLIRSSIYPLLLILDLSKSAAEPFSAIPELAALISGLAASSLIGLIYLAPPILIIWLILRLRGRKAVLRPTYPAMALALGLMFFTIAELFESSTMMMISSSMIVLSSMALAATLPTRILQGKKAS